MTQQSVCYAFFLSNKVFRDDHKAFYENQRLLRRHSEVGKVGLFSFPVPHTLGERYTIFTPAAPRSGFFAAKREDVGRVCAENGLVLKAEILDESAVARAVTRISYEMIERNKGTDGLCLIGLFSRGAVLAQRIADRIAEVEGSSVPVGLLDITPFRDDDKRGEGGDLSQIGFDITGKRVVIVDDVIFTGRTARAAIDGLMSRGRPMLIQLAVLIDRGHRELPIRADYVGKNLPTSREEKVRVMVKETDGCDKVVIYTRAD